MDLDDLRALARSAPWRWRTLRLTVTWHGGTGPDGPQEPVEGDPVRAWVDGRHGLRVADLTTGRLLLADWEDSPGGWRVTGRAGAALARRRGLAVRHEHGEWTVAADDYGVHDPRAPRATLRSDGLVARRPGSHDGPDEGLAYDGALWQTYRWVAMLDPVELADGSAVGPDGGFGGRDPAVSPVGVAAAAGAGEAGAEGGAVAVGAGEAGVAIGAAGSTSPGEVTVVDHHGRAAWEAVLTPAAAYDPRCSCCPLLPGEVASRLLLAEGGLSQAELDDVAPGWPTAHRVRLDEATGVVVELEQVDGHGAGQGWSAVVEAVDEPCDRTWFA